ncbi:MAG: ABC transporter permease [Anaerolineales bacterium]|jgi:ABC-2 type transport system permease protein|nr:ABC transporter permease [Anaerolineales bacterium]
MTETTGNNAFELVGERGWRRGFGNLLRAGFNSWWKTSSWWIQVLIWTAMINGMLAAVLFASGDIDYVEGTMIYCVFAGLFPSIAVIIIMQGAIVGEKESGTAAWVLSKPVSRSSFILSKLIANSVGVLVTMTLIPGILAFIELSIAKGELLSPINFLGGLLVIALNLLYYLTLTLMLGTLFSKRGPVIGIALALAFGQQLLFGVLPLLAYVLPWTLVVPIDGLAGESIAAALILGLDPYSIIPVISIFIQTLIFIAVSLWRFEREEF